MEAHHHTAARCPPRPLRTSTPPPEAKQAVALLAQEVIVVVLDVRPQMSDKLAHVRKSLFLLAESKVRKHSMMQLQLTGRGATMHF